MLPRTFTARSNSNKQTYHQKDPVKKKNKRYISNMQKIKKNNTNYHNNRFTSNDIDSCSSHLCH